MIATLLGEVSAANSIGRRNGTSHPNCFAIAAISLQPVVITNRSRYLDYFAACIGQYNKGRPLNCRMFFPGKPLLPPRAVIMPIVVLPLYIT